MAAARHVEMQAHAQALCRGPYPESVVVTAKAIAAVVPTRRRIQRSRCLLLPANWAVCRAGFSENPPKSWAVCRQPQTPVNRIRADRTYRNAVRMDWGIGETGMVSDWFRSSTAEQLPPPRTVTSPRLKLMK